jgi:hypothetical protein
MVRCIPAALAFEASSKHWQDMSLGLFGVAPFVSRVEGRKLHRNSGRALETPFRLFGDSVDRLSVCVGIALGIFEGPRRLAEHVEAVGQAPAALRLGAAKRLRNGPAEHELAPENPHRLVDRGADDRLAETADRPAQRGTANCRTGRWLPPAPCR